MYHAAQMVLKKLEKFGYEAYFVGGCVRDKLLGKKPADYDITTNALPEEIQRIFPRTIPTGIKHGTISVLQKNKAIEVTTYRVEENYADHRRPEQVRFVSRLEDDLRRRDFTINAMAMNRSGDVFDFVGGRKDLQNGVIRTVGDPQSRFQEDALRMLRACRFASQLSFSVEKNTRIAIGECRSFANHLAVERIVQEIEKIWKTKVPAKGLKILMETNLIQSLPPFCGEEISPQISDKEWNQLNLFPSRLERWIYFLYLVFRQSTICKQVCFTNIMSKLSAFKFSNSQKKEIKTIMGLVDKWDSTLTSTQGKLMLVQYGLHHMQLAEKMWKMITINKKQLPLIKWWKEMPIHSFSELRIKGNHLLQLVDKPAGSWMNDTLQYLFQQVVLGYLPNDAKVLEKEGEKYGTGLTP
jgi:tRNA nucleotidyltransferase (CCA-adding enzyme)